VRHKRVDLALDAARRAGKPIKVVGTGPDLERLQALHGDHAEFLGRVDDAGLTDLYARALGLIVPNVEEFGIAAVEAQAAGRPVIAYAEGGALETVLEGETGTLFHPCRPEALAESVRRFDADTVSSQACLDNAMRFDVRRFQAGLRAIVEEASELERPPRPLSRPRGRGRLRPVLVEPSG